MSDPDRIELSAQDLMPSWVTNIEKSISDRGSESRRDDREDADRDRGRKRDGGGGGRGPRRDGDRSFGNRDSRGGGFRRDRDDRDRGGPRGGGGRNREGNRDQRGGRDRGPRQVEEPLPTGITLSLEPSPGAADALARHIKGTGRTYAVADLARMVLGARDRYRIRFQTDSLEERPLYACGADHSVWLSREEAIAHLLHSPGMLDRYYQVEEVTVEPPTGNYSVVAVCGFTGQLLGPPNHHEYQMNVARLHRERFSDMSLERFKSRIEMKRDEETIEKWKEQVSTRRQYRVRPEPLSAEAPATPAPAPAEQTETGSESGESPAIDAPVEESGEEAPVSEAPSVETESVPEEAGEIATEATEESDDAEGEEEAASEETTEAEADNPEPEADAPAADSPSGEILTSEEALERHFRKTYADLAVEAVGDAVVPGEIPGRCLSRPLLNLLKSEVDRGRKAFPLGMIQHLCREFEKAGLKFFKRGKKALQVSVTRPRAIPNESDLSDRVRAIVAFVREHPKKKVVDLLDALVSDYQKPVKGETFEEHQLTEAERGVLADLRWLTMEGYVIEFPGTELLLGRAEAVAPGGDVVTEGARPKRRKKARRKAESTGQPVASEADTEETTTPAVDESPEPARVPEPTTEETGAPASEAAPESAPEETTAPAVAESPEPAPEPEPAAENPVELETAAAEDSELTPSPEEEKAEPVNDNESAT